MADWADFLGGIDWGGVAKATIPAAIGTYISSNANRKAAEQVVNAGNAATQQLQAGNLAAQQRYQSIADQTAPGLTYLRGVVADGGALTPGQQQRILDTRRQTGNLLSSKLGGRSATAIASRAASDLENSIYDENRRRSDQAAGTLAGSNLAAINAGAGQDINLGRDLATVTRGTGESVANAGLATGKLQAQAAGSVLSPQADTMSAIRSIMAENRKGSYGNA